MISEYEITVLLKLLFSSFLAFLIGIERRRVGKPAGVRTCIFVTNASTLFTALLFDKNPMTLTALMTGIGFIGAGVVLKEGNKVVGLTTATVLWMLVVVGITVGLGYYLLALATTLLSFLILQLKRVGRHG